MDPKAYFQELAELPHDEVKARITETLHKFYEASAEERANRMKGMLTALSETSEETHMKVIKARLEAMAELAEEIRSPVMATGAQVMASLPSNVIEREQRLTQKVAPELSEAAKKIVQNLMQNT